MRRVSIISMALFFVVACSTNFKHKQETMRDDLFIPGTPFYQASVGNGYEMPPVINSASFLPPYMQKSAIFTVKPAVYSDGAIDYFQIDTQWGVFNAAGIYHLKSRINEIIAIDSLNKVSAGDAVVEGVTGSVKNLVMAPINAISFIGSAFSGGDKKEKEVEVKEETVPQQNIQEGDRVAFEQRRLTKMVREDKSYTHLPAQEGETQDGGLIGSLLGYGDQVLEIQKQFNIDPNTDNDVLRAAIARVAKMKTGGSLTASAASFSPVLSTLSTVNKTVGAFNAISIYSDEATQKKRVQEELNRAGVNAALIKEFENAPGLTTMIRTEVVNTFMYLKNVGNRSEIIEIAAAVDDYAGGWYVLSNLYLLRKLYDSIHFVRFVKDSPGFIVVTADNRVIVSVAADHVYWTKAADLYMKVLLEAIRDDVVAPRAIELVLMGYPSQRFLDEVQRFGLKVTVLSDKERYSK